MAVAVIAIVVCVLSAADNEAARLEIAKAPAQGRVHQDMDFTAVERGTSSALAHDVASFLMRRAGTWQSDVRRNMGVMRKRMAQAQMPHKMAPVQGLVQHKKGCLHDIAFRHTQDPDFTNDDGCDPAFEQWTQTGDSMDAFNSAVDQGNMLEEVASKMREAGDDQDAELEDQDPEEEEEGAAQSVESGGGLSWDHVLDMAAKSWKGNEDSIPNPVAGHVLNDHTPHQEEIPNAAAGEGEGEGDFSHAVLTPSGAVAEPSFGPNDQTDESDDESGSDTAGQPQESAPVDAPQGDSHSTVVEPDIAFKKPNTATDTHDPLFPPGTHDPAMVRFSHGVVQPAPAVLTTTKTAVQLAKKAMAEHAKRLAARPTTVFDLKAMAANNIARVRIQNLKAVTARKELKYKTALAAAHSQPIQPTMTNGIKFIKN